MQMLLPYEPLAHFPIAFMNAMIICNSLYTQIQISEVFILIPASLPLRRPNSAITFPAAAF